MSPDLVAPAAAPLGVMAGVGVIGAVIVWKLSSNKEKDGDEPEFSNPFLLRQALKLGAIYAAVRLAAAAAHPSPAL
jgi:uncharacterized membrane protein (DUF4010 family)